jgi:peroxiredoxin
LISAGLLLAAAIAIQTGPGVGKKIPSFEAQDQNGKTRTLASIAGPKGAMLVFFRSADW